MTKEEMTELLEKANANGQPFIIGQYNEGNGVYVENVYTEGGGDETIAACDLEADEADESAKSADSNASFPESPYDAILFNQALKINEVKKMLAGLVSSKRENGTLKIVHWFIVWKVFRWYRFIPEEKTQAKFIRWVKDVFGWGWNSCDFKGSNVPETVRNTPLSEWTMCGLSAQRPQAEEYIRWRDLLVFSFVEKTPGGRIDCKETFYSRWFDTGVKED